jgi:hypothetical protein
MVLMKMNKLTIGILLALVATATSVTTAMVPAYADPNNPTADANVHENTPGGFAGDQDVRYHEGTCQGGSTHPACGLPIITDPGNSDTHRQDNRP